MDFKEITLSQNGFLESLEEVWNSYLDSLYEEFIKKSHPTSNDSESIQETIIAIKGFNHFLNSVRQCHKDDA